MEQVKYCIKLRVALEKKHKTRDAPKLKFLAEAEQNEILGRRPNTEHGFSLSNK